MKLNKKISAFFCVAAMVLTFSACSGNTSGDNSTTTSNSNNILSSNESNSAPQDSTNPENPSNTNSAENSSENPSENSSENNDSDILVAYFSCTGNTKNWRSRRLRSQEEHFMRLLPLCLTQAKI